MSLSPSMRATPSVSTTGQLQVYNGSNLQDCDVSIDLAAHTQLVELIISNSSGFVSKDFVELLTDNVSGVIFEISAEL